MEDSEAEIEQLEQLYETLPQQLLATLTTSIP